MNRSNQKENLEEDITRLALTNALNHEGKSHWKSVLGKLLREKPGLRQQAREIKCYVIEIVGKVNRLNLDEQLDRADTLRLDLLVKEKGTTHQKRQLPPLPNVDQYKQVVTRYAPNPNCVLHLGQARAIVLSYEYARRYNGRFILRFEDTDTRLKKSSLKFYDLIREDVEWLGCKWDEEYIQSDRINTYYEYAERLFKSSNAYVCTCKRKGFQRMINEKKNCQCRELKNEENLLRWKWMLNGTYSQGEAVVRIKTDINHPNPAIRDWPALRIIDPKKYPHPRVGSRYYVWPLFAFANGIDDHLNGVTHVIRGKEHLTNQRRQEYLYHYLDWEYPEALHYGRLKIPGTTLSKSKIVLGVQDGTYNGWDDSRLATFRALKRRGIQADAIRQLILDIGPKPVDITLSWKNLYALNRKIIEPIANRFFFVQEPVKLVIRNVPEPITAQIPFHPDHPERGNRVFKVKPTDGDVMLLVSNKDNNILKKGVFLRLMNLLNIRIEKANKTKVLSVFQGTSYDEAKRQKARLVHWLPADKAIRCKVIMPYGLEINGLADELLLRTSVDQVVQFVRFGFVRVDAVSTEVVTYFTHV